MVDGRSLGTQASLERLIVQIAAATNARVLYAPNHRWLVRAVQRVVDSVVEVCDDRREDSVTFLLVADDLVVDGHPLRRGGLHQRPVINALRRRGVERLTLGRGLELSECQQLVEALAVGGVPPSTANVVVGQIELVFSEDAESAAGEAEAGQTGGASGSGAGEQPTGLESQVDEAMEAFLRFRREQRIGLGRLEDLVWGFMDALSRSTRTMLPVAPLRDHDEYTFVHSVNVALLVLAQARSFGLQGQVLHSMGLAALLHDVGKLSIPLSILNKPGRLEGEEWNVMMGHVDLGGWYLGGLEASAPLSILVAYEHHLRFDGQPNYPLLRTPRRPTLASQMTGIADVYDAVCTTRPYRKALSREAALEILRARTGTFHDPFLVGNFCQLLDAGRKP